MQLTVIATGSTGNSYALEADHQILLLDAGLIATKILRGIDFRIRDVVGCLVTHEHRDHCRGVERLNALGVRCLGTPGTCAAVPGLTPAGQKPLTLGPFRVLPFAVLHDAAEPCGWLVTHVGTGERLLYLTDAAAVYNTFPGVHDWLVECSYMDALVTEENTPAVLRRRLSQTHMSLRKLCEVLEANDLHACRKIVLCHGSRERLDPEEARDTVARLTGKPVTVATAGLTIPLGLEPF